MTDITYYEVRWRFYNDPVSEITEIKAKDVDKSNVGEVLKIEFPNIINWDHVVVEEIIPKTDYSIDLCEWNPETNNESEVIFENNRYFHHGCPNFAQKLVGANGDYRLCNNCAALPKFKRFRKIKNIKK